MTDKASLEYLVSSSVDMKRGRDISDFLVAKGATVSTKIVWRAPNWILEVHYQQIAGEPKP